ncbi:hypothetical protein B0H14DRAFT_3493293 [Mycena olivaceomarginata]|nr:hypothetical protein B0H14DRAFT_3493293 [Mycena olivaceomarginata]
MLNLRAASELARLGRCPPCPPSALTRLGVLALSPLGVLAPAHPARPLVPGPRMLAREPLLSRTGDAVRAQGRRAARAIAPSVPWFMRCAESSSRSFLLSAEVAGWLAGWLGGW